MMNSAVFEYQPNVGEDFYNQYTYWLDKEEAVKRCNSLSEMYPKRDFFVFTKED